MASLVVTDPAGKRTVLELEEARHYSVGRSQKNDIVVADPALSRRHVELKFGQDHWVLLDCGSFNGTFIDGKRVTAPVRLRAGARLHLGSTILEYQARRTAREEISFSDAPIEPDHMIRLDATELVLDSGATPLPTGARGAEAELPIIRRRLNIIEHATLELLAHEPMETLLPRILDLAFEAVRPDRAALFQREADGELICRAQRDVGGAGMVISRTIANSVLDDRVSLLATDAQTDIRFADAESLVMQGVRAVMAVPMLNKDDVYGFIYVDSQMSSRRFDDEDLRVLTMLANIAAIQIENARLFAEQVERRRFEREVEAAAQIQRRLLPQRPPSVPGYRFDGRTSPCYEVGGDYWDCLTLDDRRRVVVLGDVAGKGMGAALLMAGLQATFHARVETKPELLELIDYLNSAIAERAPSNRFVTLFLMVLETERHRVSCVNAGHAPSPLIVRADGSTEKILPGGPPLGVVPGYEYETRSIELGAGDTVFACSDGVTEAVNVNGDAFDDERLLDVLTVMAGHPPHEMCEALEEQLTRFVGEAGQSDDLTIVAVQREA